MALFHFRPRLFHKTANWKTTICVIEGSAPPHPETTIFIITKIKRRRFNLAKRRVEVVFFIGRPSKGGAFMSEGDVNRD
jgi:hypothetical protein